MKTLSFLSFIAASLIGTAAQAQSASEGGLTLAPSKVTVIVYTATGTTTAFGGFDFSWGSYLVIPGLGTGSVDAIGYTGPELSTKELYVTVMPFFVAGTQDFGGSFQMGWYPKDFAFYLLADTSSDGAFAGFTQGFFRGPLPVGVGYIGKWSMQAFKQEDGLELAGSLGPATSIKMGPLSLNCGWLFGGSTHGLLCNAFLKL